MTSISNSSFIFEGNSNAPVVVLASSLGASLEMWDAQARVLSPHFRVLRYSYQGHGATPEVGSEANIENLRQDLLVLLDRLNIQSFSFLGLSLGAMLGIYLAAKNPERVQALVAANFRPFQIDSTKEQWNQRIEAVRSKGIDAIVDGTADRWLSESFRASYPVLDQRVRQMIRGTTDAGFMACAKAVRDYDARPFLKDVLCPVLLIAGSEDVAAPVSEYPLMQASIPNNQYVLLKAAHISSIECEAEFNEQVLRFFQLDNGQKL
jgi:3-oxoadipate enol-lactonase